jgi:acid phosphatase family membrane protein YuiD
MSRLDDLAAKADAMVARVDALCVRKDAGKAPTITEEQAKQIAQEVKEHSNAKRNSGRSILGQSGREKEVSGLAGIRLNKADLEMVLRYMDALR